MKSPLYLFQVNFKRYYLEKEEEEEEERERERERERNDPVKHERLSLQDLRVTIGCYAITFTV